MSWDDETRDDDVPEEGAEAPAGDDQAGEHESPPPATYAGRKRAEQGGDQEEPESEEPAAGEEPQAPAEPEDPEDIRAGFTEEFDEIERSLDEELAGLGEPRDAEPAAAAEAEAPDEAEEPADEPEDDEPEDGEEAEEEEDVARAEGYQPGTGPADPGGGAEESAGSGSGETVEADTVGGADKEAATDAALAALRARAAVKGPQPAAPAAEAASGGAQPVADPTDPGSAAEESVGVDSEEPAGIDSGKPPRAKRLWARFLAASVMIVISMAAATSISLLVYLTDIASGLSDNDKLASLRDQLAEVDGGDPQTILIIGSDKRLGMKGDPGRSDTTILLRVDPDKDAIALLSIPRDLKFNIPGVGLAKFNEAFTAGGPPKTLKVVQQLTGLEINHVVNINFTGFADAVDAIECVYIDVDRHYYIAEDDPSDTAAINVEAGYQRMCGYNALQYVRFRHFDNDLVRAARQQDFLREARQKLPPGKLIDDRNELLDIFTEYTTSDIGDAVQLLELLKTFLAVRSAPVSEVHFPAELGATYVTASDSAIKKAVEQFLNVEGTPGERPAGESPPPDKPDKPEGGADNKPHGGGNGDNKPDEEKPKPDGDNGDHFVGPEMQDSSAEGQTYAKQALHKRKHNGERMIDFPVYYPARLAPGSFIARDSRAFVIDGPGDDVYHGYKMVVDVPGDTFGHGLTDEYYGISGTDWVDAPILANPSETRTIDGREYSLFYDGDRLRLVGFKTNQGAYWVNNTLLQSLDEGQMLSIATSLREFEEK
jgi:LCP family protein required for cell wall assembly